MEPATWQSNDTRYKHFLYCARVAEDARFETTSPIIVIVSQIEAEGMPPLNWAVVLYDQADDTIIFGDAVRKDWIVSHAEEGRVCLEILCKDDAGHHHNKYLEFDSTLMVTLFHQQVLEAVQGCKIGLEWDDTVEEAVEGLLDFVCQTVDVPSLPKAPVSLVVLEGDIGVTTAWDSLLRQLWKFMHAMRQGIAGLVFPSRG